MPGMHNSKVKPKTATRQPYKPASRGPVRSWEEIVEAQIDRSLQNPQVPTPSGIAGEVHYIVQRVLAKLPAGETASEALINEWLDRILPNPAGIEKPATGLGRIVHEVTFAFLRKLPSYPAVLTTLQEIAEGVATS